MQAMLDERCTGVLDTIRKRHKQIRAELLQLDDASDASVSWITINGTHIPLDENGTALAGGKLTGRNFGKGTAASKKPATSLRKEVTPQRTDYDYDPNSDDVQDFVHKNVDKLMDVYDTGGMPAVKDEFYRFRMADTSNDLHEVSSDSAHEVLYDNIPQGVKDGWMREANSGYKPKLIASVLQSSETRNAALNVMYQNYKYSNPGDGISFNDFLDTPVTMYRGGHGQAHTKDDIFSAYSFDRKIAEKFAGEDGRIYTAKIRPIDTYGSLSENGESEIFVPSAIAPNKNRDSR